MALERQRPAILRFGTFEVDLRAGELRKQGIRLKLQDQPFQVLSVLLQRPGDVVTREELRTQIWPEDTFVDFDNSLNTAINKLREVLGDSADNPRFIETLPRRGYRFLPPVGGDGREARTKSIARWKVGVTALIVVAAGVLAVAGGVFWHWRQRHVLSERDTIVLGDFANSTGDSVFDGTLREGLSVQLEQSPFLSLVSEDGIHQTLRMMGQPANARLTPEITQEVCQRTNSATAVYGSIALIGTRYDVILKATTCVNGALLASTEVQANDKSHVLDALSSAATQIRSKLGESLSSVQKYNTALEQVTTPSLEALQAFSVGQQRPDTPSTLAFLQRAIQLDHNFAMAYWRMGIAYSSIGETSLGRENMRKAFELRAGVSDRERLHIETDYYIVATGDLLKAQHVCELGEQAYPRDSMFHFPLRLIFYALGRHEEGLKENLETLRLVPYSSFVYRTVAGGYLMLDQIKEAEATIQEAQAKGLDSLLPPIRYRIAFYRSDPAEMARQVANAANKPELEDLLLELEADTAAYFGHLEKAREFSLRAADSIARAGEKGTASGYEAVAALRDALFGNGGKALQQAEGAKKHYSGRDMEYAVALAFAYAGGASEAQALAGDLAKTYPEDTIVQVNYLPALRGKLALLRANPQEALELLRAATSYELGAPVLGYYDWPNLYPVYVRGEAYLAAHQGQEAAAEFQKILDHRGVVLNEPIGALAHLQLGRAYALQGDTVKARTAYQDFLTLWKDADPDIPIVKNAKSEYAKLS